MNNLLEYIYGPYLEKQAAFNMERFKGALRKKHNIMIRNGEPMGVHGRPYVRSVVNSIKSKKADGVSRLRGFFDKYQDPRHQKIQEASHRTSEALGALSGKLPKGKGAGKRQEYGF